MADTEYVDEDTYRREQGLSPISGTSSPAMPNMGGSAAYQPPQDRYGSSIITLTNPKDDLYKFELFLRSMQKRPDGTLAVVGKPLLNDKGINSVMACVESLVHHMNTLSNFDERTIQYFIVGLADTIIKDLMMNRLTYDVDRKNRDIIVDNAVRFAHGFVMRAYKEGDRKFWKGSVQEVKHTQEITGQQKSGFNPFNMFKKG